MAEPFEISEYFKYDQKSFAVAKAAITKLPRLSDVLKYLVESKPPCLKVGESLLGVDQHQLAKQVDGIADKLIIHGYTERGERLRYLYHILTKKLSEQDDFLKTAIKLMFEISENPTGLLRLEVGSQIFSQHPDEEMSGEENSVSDKELLQQILGETGDFEAITISYSSGSELSDWSTDGEGEKTNETVCDIVKSEIKLSHSFSDFSSVQLPQDEESKRQELEMYWNLEAVKAKTFLKTPSVVPRSLRGQPVITGRLALQAKFGEHWEWKHAAANGSQRFILPETLVIREILWQFSILNPDSSTLFTSDWNLKPGLMTSSLTFASFSSMMQIFQTALSTLHKLKIFVQRTFHNSTVLQQNMVPKMLLSYAQALSDFLQIISEDVVQIDRQLKQSTLDETSVVLPCTTLLQLLQRLRKYFPTIDVLNELHSSNFEPLSELSNTSFSDRSKSCFNVFFSLGKRLDGQTQSMTWGILLYIFLKCLHAFLEEINAALELDWNEHLVFKRYPDVKISDHNFWTECIKVRDFKEIVDEQTSSSNLLPPCLSSLANEITSVLKTSEMLKQLDEDSVKIIGYPPLPAEVVLDYLNSIFPTMSGIATEKSESVLQIFPDYETHFRFLGLGGSLEADAVKNILQDYRKTLCSNKKETSNNIKWLLTLENTSTMNHWDALDVCLKKWYQAICTKAKNCIHKIFLDYKVDQSLKTFREIILETREDFAQSVIALVSLSGDKSSNRYKWEDQTARNPGFQKLLSDCYPEGRENFEIELMLDRMSDTKYTLIVKPHFPLNLVLLEDSIQGYLFVSRQLSRLRTNLWQINALSIKDFKLIEGVEANRVLLFRFALIHFCSSLRAYLVLKIFGKDLTFCTTNSVCELDEIRKGICILQINMSMSEMLKILVHADHLKTVEIELLRNPVMEKVILRKMGEMCRTLQKLWKEGVPSRTMALLEDTLKKCWNVIHDFRKNSSDFNELAFHFGPTPSYL